MAQSDKTIALYVTLREESLKALTNGVSDVSLVLSNRCKQYLELTVHGAVLVTPDQVSEIERNIGKEITDGQDIVRASEKRSPMRDGKYLVEFAIDPTWLEPLQERSREAGRPLEELMADVMDIAFQNDWAFSLMPKYPPVYAENYEYFIKLTGKTRPTGPDIEEAIREIQSSARKTKRELAGAIA